MNLTSYLATTKFSLTKPQLNLISKLEAMGLEVDPLVTEVQNPVTGYTGLVDPFIACLINWVYTVHATYKVDGSMNYRGHKVATSTFDRVRYIILDVDKPSFRNYID